ncbi:MAG: hypothetical protein LHV68_10550 [Elusimicrobia bacterium]|nr:hypothetical protein [Candidatus Liberimonas magnetica]
MTSLKDIRIILSFIFALVFMFNGCKPSYPKGQIEESLSKVLKKEYNIDSKVVLKTNTLYLDINLLGLTSTEVKALSDVLKTVQNAMLTITRIALSSDAKVEYMVVNVKDPAWKLSLKLVQRMDDVKSLLYQRISRSDYEGRFILEINKSDNFEAGELEKNPLSMNEFIGRLIVSQVNMVNRTNPFLSVLLNNSQLYYKGFDNNELIIGISGYLGDKTLPFFKSMLVDKTKEIIKKYKIMDLKTIKIVTDSNQQTDVIDLTTYKSSSTLSNFLTKQPAFKKLKKSKN